MDFFDHQDKARRATRWLIVIYILVAVVVVAVVTFGTVAMSVFFPAVIMNFMGAVTDSRGHGPITADLYTSVPAEYFIGTAAGTALIILVGTLYRSATLLSGGGKVAAALGGTPLLGTPSDPLARRLRNVVEEMAIASGAPVPDIYVLEQEAGINAFAAGFTPGDAALTVTRGALEHLDRDELQGVIAHEFSHILNGDMRLNIRLMGLLFGITAIHSIGRTIMIGGFHLGKGMGATTLGFGAGADKVGAADSKILGWFVLVVLFFLVLLLAISFSIMTFGVVVALLGLLGVYSARAIKSAVSRQREYLADASAIQFTRQTVGIAGALKKMGEQRGTSLITRVDAEEVSHMLFGRGSKSFLTHPPVADRIKALGPVIAPPPTAPRPTSEEDAPIKPVSVVESVGQPEPAHIEYAEKLRASIPEDLYSAAHSVGQSYLLTLALILDRSGQHLEQQMSLLEEDLGAELTGLVENFHERVTQLGAEYRLPLLELAFPALKRRPAVQIVELTELANRLVQSDGEIDLYEFCFYRILLLNLRQALAPSADSTRRRGSQVEVAKAAVTVVAIVAESGHEDPAEAQAAFGAGAALLGKWAVNAGIDLEPEFDADTLDKSLDLLLQLNGKGRRTVLLAICEAAAHDGHLHTAEGELIRVLCATLDCPLPPILND